MNVQVTPLFPDAMAIEPTKGNGNASEQEQKRAAKPTKAVTTKGQKKTAITTRRVVRKNTNTKSQKSAN